MEVEKVAGVEKLLDVLASGIGSVAGPMLAPWKARREGEAKLIEAKGAAKILSIHAQAQADARRMLSTESSAVRGEIELGEEISQRIEYQERKRQANIVRVVEQAAQQDADEIVPAVEPDHDWTARFFREVQDVSSEEIQSLWSRVLAGQVREPGTTSMRTLDILKDVDVTTARLFWRFCSAAVYLKGREGEILDARVPSLGGNAGQNAIAKFGFDFGQLNRLNENGLIISDYDSYNTYVVVRDLDKGRELGVVPSGCTLGLGSPEQKVKEKTVKLHGGAMTVAGSELSRVVTPQPIAEYTKALRGFLQDKFGIRMNQVQEAVSLFRG